MTATATWFRIDREESSRGATFGELFCAGLHECLTLEDEVRELPGVDVALWKIFGVTAVPALLGDLTLENSRRFGPCTITISPVPGFRDIRMHGGTDAEDTEGCPLVGDAQDRLRMTIAGAKFHGVLGRLKARVGLALSRGRARIQIRNAPEWYARYGLPYPEVAA